MASIRTTSAVLVCKEFSDTYNIALAAKGFQSYFIPVLATHFVGVERLQHIVRAGPESAFSGVIVTSSRGADAWTNVVHKILELNPDDMMSASSWSEIPFYTVGKATEKSLKACPPCKYSPALVLGANETGTGEALAHYILKHHSAYDTSLPLLYLTGDKNRDTVPVTLAEGGLKTTPTQVYETRKRDGLEADLKDTISTILSASQQPIWLVLFSPSTSDIVLPIADSELSIPKATPPPSTSRTTALLAGIGPTTSKHLESSGYVVSVTSPKPDADSLAAALLYYS